MCASQALSFGVGLIAFIGYGCAISFALMSLVALSMVFWVKQDSAGRQQDLDVFAIAGVIAFIAAAITAVVIKLIG
jgi:hypothetical protein